MHAFFGEGRKRDERTNGQTHIGGWVENVMNKQTHIGGWVKNMTNGRTHRGKQLMYKVIFFRDIRTDGKLFSIR